MEKPLFFGQIDFTFGIAAAIFQQPYLSFTEQPLWSSDYKKMSDFCQNRISRIFAVLGL